jgi:hypothetical protein
MQTGTVTGRLVFVVMMLNLGVAVAHAEQGHVRMTFSGTNVATTINLQTNTVTDETQLAGRGSLGRFTFRELHADGAAPPNPCMGPSFAVLKGAGVFTFQDGSLLIVTVANGTGCVNLAAGKAALVISYRITGGTGRFTSASGNLTMSATLMAVLRNAANAPALLTNTGKFEGTIVGVAGEDEEGED